MDKIQESVCEFEALPREKSIGGGWIVKYKGFWCPEMLLQPTLSFQKHFISKDSDILLATLPKAGTTWLKALVFSIVHRNQYSIDQSPLLTSNPHALVPFDHQLKHGKSETLYQENNTPSSPGVFATHLPYDALPNSIFKSKCKIVYLCRNPLDQFISQWHFVVQNVPQGKKAMPLNEALELVFEGINIFGPFWEQIMGYWNASLECPNKVLFLKYEDLRKDDVFYVKKIAEFLGFPFGKEEEENGLIEEITKLCSFRSLSNMEVNKHNKMHEKYPVKNSSYFRKGEVGDWLNYLTPEMAGRAARIIQEKFGDSGLTFEFV
ncbi:hypothetical protein ACH5RR_025129 [Cinchona calisaya]|uniref:Sulfotransferase n=1 Tax=Cinchona calisaya TaxID=153742 RepID=A0ABD2YYR5_9GENT